MSPPQPRILMTTDAIGGVWTYSAALARELCARNYDVTLVTMGPAPQTEQLAALRGTRALDIQVTDLALEWMDPDGDDVGRARERLRRIVNETEPDIIHLNSYREALFDLGAPTVVVAHSCVGSWWEACRDAVPIEAKWRPYLARVGDSLDAANAWVAPTQAYRDWLQRYYAPARGGHVIWNGVPPMRAPAAKENVILAAGRLWDEAKNLAAVARIASSLPWPVRMAGPACGENGTASRHLTGVEQLGALPHPELIAEMRKAAIFVSPALYEPFGLGVLEAASCGCALVLADIATFRELWRDAALFADPRDDKALGEAIRTLCRNERLRTSLQHEAQQRARGYSLEAMVDRYCELYARIALSSRVTRPLAPVFAEAAK